MPRNDRSDSLSVRDDDDPRRPMRGLQNEAERELADEEKHATRGSAQRGPGERERQPSKDEEEYARAVRRATEEQERDPRVPGSGEEQGGGGSGDRGGGDRTRGA